MSRKVPREQYEKTLSYKLKTWLEGSRDLYLDNVEMRPQSPRMEDETLRQRFLADKRRERDRVYDTKNNRERYLKSCTGYSAFCSVSCWCPCCSSAWRTSPPLGRRTGL